MATKNVFGPIHFSFTKATAKEKVEAHYWIFPVRRILEIFASLMCCSQSVKQVNTRGHLVSERWLVKVNTGGTCTSNPPTPDRGPMPTSSTTAGEGVEMLMGLRSAKWSDWRGRTQFSGRMQTSRAADSERSSYVSKVDSHALAKI